MEFKKNIKIVIAEDSFTQAAELQFILEENGYTVFHALNGIDALKLIKDKNPDLVISDILMPEMNGYELCEQINSESDTKDIPVLLLTQLSDSNDVIKGLQSGADNFISKPYTDKFLLRKVEDVLVNKEIRSTETHVENEVFFNGKKFTLNSSRLQILDLLLSTYENAVSKNKELVSAHEELKIITSELDKKNSKLEQLNEEKNFFLGMAAHDLRSPLAVIFNYTELLQDVLKPKLDDRELKLFNVIEKTSTFMLDLVSSILDISAIESGNITLNKTEIDLISFFQQNIELNNFLARKKNIEVFFTYPETTYSVVADKDKLTQIMNNLLSNAIKFSHSNTQITVSMEKREGYIDISVEDEGPGIPNNELNTLFQPFTKTSVRSLSSEKSTGLGLALVKKIIEAHKGIIKVESIVNVGSKFIFSIPSNS